MQLFIHHQNAQNRALKFGLVDKVAGIALFLLDISTTFLYSHDQE